MCTIAFLEQEQGKHKAELDAQKGDKGDLGSSLKEIHRLLRVELGDDNSCFLRFLSSSPLLVLLVARIIRVACPSHSPT
jgi:hypothetical protein